MNSRKTVEGFKKLFLLLFLGFTFVQFTSAQNVITGIVSDAKTGETLVGATVYQKSQKSSGTITDVFGKYQIVAEKGTTLVFSYVGYNKKEIVVADKNEINIALESSATNLEEFIVVGYGVQKKTDKTGAVANIKTGELNRGVITDPIQTIQGKTAGVTITKKGGDPNAGFSVKIRGAAGIAAGSNPLYVVDGVPGVDPSTIAPEDIDAFNILKDASSTAIYGSRGANGVVIITTKNGSAKTGTKVDFNTYMSMDNVANKLDLLSADQIRAYADENNYNLLDNGANTDWQDEIYRQGVSQSYNFAISGGNENSTYRASVTRLGLDGVLIGSEKDRTIGRLNLTQKALDGRLTVKTNLSGAIEGNDYISYSGNGSNDILYQAFQRNPTDPVYNEDGSYHENQRNFQYYNPVALVNQIQNHRDAKRYMGSMRADLEVMDGLVAGVNLAYTRDDDESFYFEPSYVRNSSSTGFGKRQYHNSESKLLETTLTYTKSIEKHNMNAVAGYSFQEDMYDGFYAQGYAPLSDFVQSNNLGSLTTVNVGDIGSYKNSSRLISFFGRVTYNYDSKYYFTGTVRRDGSSKFGINNEWGVFPSASAAWTISNEDFLSDVDVISNLKLRVGYGLAGNQNIDPYLDVMTVSPSGSAPNFETGEDGINFQASHNANPDLKWEVNKELNFGLDFGLFNDRISGSVEYYRKTISDLLAAYAVPVPPNAVGTTFANVGEISNNGVGVNIQAYVLDINNFKWKTTVAFSKYKQMVESLSGDGFEWTPMHTGWLSGRGLVGAENWSQIVAPGYELGTFYMPEYAGLSADGKFLFYTAAGGVTRNIADAERREVGHALPDFELGWSNYFTIYNNIDVSFAWRAVVGGDVLNVTRLVLGNPNVLPGINALQEALTEHERGLTDNPKVNSYYLEDGSFLRLDNITIGYTFDTENINWISKCRVYVTSNNLFTITNYKGIDPEVNYSGLSFGLDQYNVYPKTRTFTFGVNVSF